MRDLDSLNHFPVLEKLVNILCKKTHNNDPQFFRILVAYYFSKVASMMRVKIGTHDRGEIPVNMYAINLAPSGNGKGHSTNIIEEHVINQFKDRFLEETFLAAAEENMNRLAVKRAIKKRIDEESALAIIKREFEDLGELAFSFDSGTPAAVKQMRQKLLIAGAGSMNLEIDEIGSNLLSNADVLNVFLELYDVGKIKQKLTKNTNENKRIEELDGKTPTNLMLYGTPDKLLDGGRVEHELDSFFETGYGRRCFFGYTKGSTKNLELTPQELYDLRTDKTTDQFMLDLSDHLAELADPVHFDVVLTMDKPVALLNMEYQLHCERLAETLPSHQNIRKAEIQHRYFKVQKLAGVFAFIEGVDEVTEDHMYAAIKLAEESGQAFERILTRERNYVKLAKYISTIGRDVTHVDLVEELPFYKGNTAQKNEMLQLAITYGYQNNIIIKKSFIEGIEFLRGETLKETDLNEMIVSYSDELAYNYEGGEMPFDKLHELSQLKLHNWCTHHFKNNHRLDSKAIPGFNMIVIDVDGECPISTAKLLLEDYKYFLYTTKSHTQTENRYRLVFPMTHVLELDADDYSEFMENIYSWLPFEVDEGTKDRSRKWACNDSGTYYYNDGKLFDALEFIPKTTKNEKRIQQNLDMSNLNNLERWFIQKTGSGNRNKQLVKYAFMLVDAGLSIQDVQEKVLSLNNKLPDKLTESEILSTVMISAAKKAKN